MRIKLRPYHSTFVVAYFGMGGKKKGNNKNGFNTAIDKIRKDPDIEIELVEEYDDICKRCDNRVKDEKGSIWGERHTCPSAQDESIVNEVKVINNIVFCALGLHFGSVIKLSDIVKLLSKRIPRLDDIRQGAKLQGKYEKGLSTLLSFTSANGAE